MQQGLNLSNFDIYFYHACLILRFFLPVQIHTNSSGSDTESVDPDLPEQPDIPQARVENHENMVFTMGRIISYFRVSELFSYLGLRYNLIWMIC